ncbi:MAG: molybdopterin-dependent oxidoreductase [Gammaproteobacteria bacterium]|nr:molybdopterin-dependent oxidoreductase [Gammaproteobacteria bacterium]
MAQENIHAYCPLCISHCGCIATVEDGRLLKLEADPEHPTGKGFCIKGKSAPEQVESPERLLYPMKRTAPRDAIEPGWQRISWDEALEITAQNLQRLAGESGAESVAFSVTTPSGTAVGDAMPWMFRLINAFGSPNTVWTTHVCNWHKDFTPQLTVGTDNGMPDYANTGCIIHWGFNPTTTWPAQAQAANAAIKRGAKLIVVDPRRSGLANKADLWLRLRPGTDGALMLGIAAELLRNDWYDQGFIRDWSNGPFLVRADNGRFLDAQLLGAGRTGYVAWDSSRQQPIHYDTVSRHFEHDKVEPALFGEYPIATCEGEITCRPAFSHYAALCRDYPPERVEVLTGVPAAQVREAARLLHQSGPVSFYAWAGLAQSDNATQTSRALSLLYSLTGDLDAPGGNVTFTKPALNNVMGLELMSEQQRKRTLGVDAHPLGPHQNGWITTRELYPAITEGNPYPVRGLFAFGSNLLTSRPRPDQGEEALARLDFYVHCDLHHNPMSRFADLLLPVASPWERSGLMAGFAISQEADARLQLRSPLVPAQGEARAEQWIIFELAKRLGLGEHFFDGDVEAGLRHVLAPSGVSLEQLRQQPQGVQLPLPLHYRKYKTRGFNTPSGRVEIYSEQLLDAGQSPLPDYIAPANSPQHAGPYPLHLTSAKWIPYCHSQYRDIPRLRRLLPEPLVEIHPATAAARQIADGDEVVLSSPAGQMRGRARYNPELLAEVICAHYGWWSWNDSAKGDANFAALIDNRVADPISGSLPLRSGQCEIRALEAHG